MYLSTIQSSYRNLINHPFISFLAITEKNLLIEILRELVPSDGLFQSRCFYQPPRPGYNFQLNLGHFHLVLVRYSSCLQKIRHVYQPVLCIQVSSMLEKIVGCNFLKSNMLSGFCSQSATNSLGAGPSSFLVSFSSYFAEIISN